MNQLNRLIVAVGFMALLFSCEQQPQYLQFQDIAQEEWSKNDTLTFQVPSSLLANEAELLIRHSNGYQFKNIWVLVGTEKENLQRQEVLLGAPSGQWLGDKSGGLYTVLAPIKVDAKNDTTAVNIVHAMRAEPLGGVQSVGVKIN